VPGHYRVAVEIRLANLADAGAIQAIYNEAVATTATFDLRPRSLAEQEAWLTERSGAHAALVAVTDEREVAGFASLSPYRSRPAYSTTVEDSVYVAASHHGQGIGSRLLGELVSLADRHGFHSIIGRIVGQNEASIRLHRSHGFALVGVEREVGRKFNRWLDVVVVQRLPSADPADT